MKKLNWSGLDFLRRPDRSGAIARDSNSNSSHHLWTNRWSSESKLHKTENVSHISDFGAHQETTLSNKGRLSFSDLLRLRRNPSDGGFTEGKNKLSIFDTLKRKFKIARSEHSRIKQMNKRHSFSLSISSIAEESCDRDVLHKSRTLSSVQQTCRLCSMPLSSGNTRGTLCDIHSELDPLAETHDDQNDNLIPPHQVRNQWTFFKSLSVTLVYLLLQEAVPFLRNTQEEEKPQTIEVITTAQEETSQSSITPTLAINANNNSNLAWEIFKLVKTHFYNEFSKCIVW